MPFPIRVSDVMSTPVRTIPADATTAEAAAECYDQEINSLVVLADEKLVGIVTGTDLLGILGRETDPGTYAVHDVMTTHVLTTSPETPVDDAVEEMNTNDVARLVVVDNEGKPVGMVSTDDVVRYVPQILHRRKLMTTPASRRNLDPTARPDTAYENRDWEFESTADSRDQVSVGDRVRFTKTISEQDVRTFAAASGDTNRLHLDESFAEGTRFGRRIVHGTLASGLISAALARLPGLTVYLSQDLTFLAPVEIGERVTADCEVIDEFGPRKYELTTDVCGPDGERAIEGEATVLVDSTPA